MAVICLGLNMLKVKKTHKKRNNGGRDATLCTPMFNIKMVQP